MSEAETWKKNNVLYLPGKNKAIYNYIFERRRPKKSCGQH